eukprot:COSAG06_NODE_24457_length_662_cov_0.817052_1_plen_31_part_10
MWCGQRPLEPELELELEPEQPCVLVLEVALL